MVVEGHGRRLYDRPEPQMKVDLNVYIPELTSRVLSAYGLETLRPRYDLAPLGLSADQTLPLGLILTELVTNACKYAFPDHPDPCLELRVERVSTSVQVAVSDNGPGFSPEPGTARTYGLRLIELQVKQLRGHFTITQASGTRFELTFPLSA
ncbi:MAG: sensor histidine kinase [Cytophagaceae bacterium]|nr:sensor histidine kinase [Cytophagaceae bacterium]